MGIYDDVYTILVEECGASSNDWMRKNFVYTMLNDPECAEYRFQGALGFGGKFWPGSGDHRNPPYVNCYPEDKTTGRQVMIERANARLEELFNV